MKKYHIKLSVSERSELTAITHKRTVAAQKKLRAPILLACDEGDHGPHEIDTVIAAHLPTTTRTIESLRAWATEVGPINALNSRPSSRTYKRKLDGAGEARLIALACSKAPEGRDKWTLQLLAEELVTLAIVDEISDETVRRTLKKMSLNLT